MYTCTYRQFRVSNSPDVHVFGLWEERKTTDMGKYANSSQKSLSTACRFEPKNHVTLQTTVTSTSILVYTGLIHKLEQTQSILYTELII